MRIQTGDGAHRSNNPGSSAPGSAHSAGFLEEIPALFDWLASAIPIQTVQTAGVRIGVAGGEAIDASWIMPERPQVWGFNSSVEEIRFAASNHLCIELGYQNSKRIIEPYSIRRSQEGNFLLYAVKAASGEAPLLSARSNSECEGNNAIVQAPVPGRDCSSYIAGLHAAGVHISRLSTTCSRDLGRASLATVLAKFATSSVAHNVGSSFGRAIMIPR